MKCHCKVVSWELQLRTKGGGDWGSTRTTRMPFRMICLCFGYLLLHTPPPPTPRLTPALSLVAWFCGSGIRSELSWALLLHVTSAGLPHLAAFSRCLGCLESSRCLHLHAWCLGGVSSCGPSLKMASLGFLTAWWFDGIWSKWVTASAQIQEQRK